MFGAVSPVTAKALNRQILVPRVDELFTERVR